MSFTVAERIVALRQYRLHLLHGIAEDKDIVFAHLLGDFDVGAVQRADRQRAVQRQLHVAGAGGLFAGGGDLLGDIRRRDHQFGHRHAVVGNERHFQAIFHQRIVIDLLGRLVDRVNDVFAR